MSEAPARAIPKSVTLAWSPSSTITLCGLRSRWMTPRRWANRAALRICSVMSIARIGSSGASLADQLLERAAREVLHRDVVRAVVGAAVVDADDVGVLEAGRRLGLAAEALDEVRVLGEAAVQQLQRDLAPELLVLGQEHVGHPPGAEAREHLVAAVDDRAVVDARSGIGSCRSSVDLREQRLDDRPWRSAPRRSRRSRPGTARSSPRSPPSGSAIGAKPMNHGWVRFDPWTPTCAVPVLPANVDAAAELGRACRCPRRPPASSSGPRLGGGRGLHHLAHHLRV